MYIGADYYPEHWPRRRWKTDARLMQQAGFNVVRLAEFAWIDLEPAEGQFDFAWLDEALGVLHDRGISAILCTPTAVTPAWLARKYPQTQAMQKDGTRMVWGVRKDTCYSSGTLRLLSERITRAMGEHFADAPNVIGWQTDNEFGHPVCYCATCRSEFQDFLCRRHGTLEAFNAAMGNHFWGHKARTWEEIPIPANEDRHNPSLCLEWRRFYSFLNVRFQRDQVRILRQTCPKHFVTHNFMGQFDELNYYELAEDLDHVSWDNYPVWNRPEVHYKASAAADLMRGLKRRNFWIMEQTAGPPGGTYFYRNPRPGEIRKVSFQQLAHGCDGQVWFRWRTCTVGREQYWHGLLGHDGRPLRRYKEAAQVAGEYHKLAKRLTGTTVRSKVAIVWDYDSSWALKIQPCWYGNTYPKAVGRYYDALFRAGVNVDMVPPSADFSQYKAVIAPELYVMPDELAERLSEYVKGGGVLLTDTRSGAKDEHGRMHERTLPGLLSDALGITIEEYETMMGREASEGFGYAVVGRAAAVAGEFTAESYADWARATKADVLAGYTDWHMRKFAAATRNAFGKGCGYYVGAVVAEPEFYDAIIADVLKTARVWPVVRPPAGVEVSVRQGKGAKLLFLINHTEQPQEVQVPAGKKELLTGKKTGDSLKLDRFGVAVIDM